MEEHTGYLVGKKKKFDPKLLEKYDTPARRVVKAAFGEAVKDNPDIYGQDLIINTDCRFKYLEVQVCSEWVNPQYPHDTVYLYARKLKYGDDTLFLTLNKFLTRGLLFNTRKVDRDSPRRLRKYSREFVYDVPWTSVSYVFPESLDEITLQLA